MQACVIYTREQRGEVTLGRAEGLPSSYLLIDKGMVSDLPRPHHERASRRPCWPVGFSPHCKQGGARLQCGSRTRMGQGVGNEEEPGLLGRQFTRLGDTTGAENYLLFGPSVPPTLSKII